MGNLSSSLGMDLPSHCCASLHIFVANILSSRSGSLSLEWLWDLPGVGGKVRGDLPPILVRVLEVPTANVPILRDGVCLNASQHASSIFDSRCSQLIVWVVVGAVAGDALAACSSIFIFCNLSHAKAVASSNSGFSEL